MKKLKLKGMGSQSGRYFFIIKKEKSFFNNLDELTKELKLPTPESFYEYIEETRKDFTDLQDNVKNKDYDLDIIYGKKRIFLIFRTNQKNRKKLIDLILSLSENIEKTMKP